MEKQDLDMRVFSVSSKNTFGLMSWYAVNLDFFRTPVTKLPVPDTVNYLIGSFKLCV